MAHMFHLRPLILVVALVSAVLLLRYAYVSGGSENWVPAMFPFPGAGLRVRDHFRLSSGGQFTLEVETPAQGTPSPTGNRGVESRTVPCVLDVVIAGSNGFRYTRTIQCVHGGGESCNADLYYPEGTIQFPAGGDYTIEIASHANAEAFAQSGALLRLTRFEPVGRELSYPLAKGVAYAIFLIVSAAQFRRRVDAAA
jgi:hypothetical protein